MICTYAMRAAKTGQTNGSRITEFPAGFAPCPALPRPAPPCLPCLPCLPCPTIRRARAQATLLRARRTCLIGHGVAFVHWRANKCVWSNPGAKTDKRAACDNRQGSRVIIGRGHATWARIWCASGAHHVRASGARARHGGGLGALRGLPLVHSVVDLCLWSPYLQ